MHNLSFLCLSNVRIIKKKKRIMKKTYIIPVLSILDCETEDLLVTSTLNVHNGEADDINKVLGRENDFDEEE